MEVVSGDQLRENTEVPRRLHKNRRVQIDAGTCY